MNKLLYIDYNKILLSKEKRNNSYMQQTWMNHKNIMLSKADTKESPYNMIPVEKRQTKGQ